VKDRDVLFHKKWLGLAQPIDGLVFSVPVLADAQIAPEVSIALSTAFEAQLDTHDPEAAPRIRSLVTFFRTFLGYDQLGMLVPRSELPADLSFYAAEGGQELRPSFALGSGPFTATSDDPFAAFDEQPATPPPPVHGAKPTSPWTALLWDLTETGTNLGMDAPEAVTGPGAIRPRRSSSACSDTRASPSASSSTGRACASSTLPPRSRLPT
jgi:hypothetical protein